MLNRVPHTHEMVFQEGTKAVTTSRSFSFVCKRTGKWATVTDRGVYSLIPKDNLMKKSARRATEKYGGIKDKKIKNTEVVPVPAQISGNVASTGTTRRANFRKRGAGVALIRRAPKRRLELGNCRNVTFPRRKFQNGEVEFLRRYTLRQSINMILGP